jgi:nicotinamide mononucleotide adenylyltransferase
MLVDHILSTAGDVVIVLGFENRARREREKNRERSRVICVTLEKKKRKKRVKYASCKSDLAEFHGNGSWIASCKA